MSKLEHKNFRDYSLKKLQDPEFASVYLNEALTDEDQRVFLLALKNVIEAQGNDISFIAKTSDISRQHIYRILSEKGNPRLTNIRSLLNVMGLELAIHPRK